MQEKNRLCNANQLEQDIKSRCNPHRKCMKTKVFYFKSDMHLRPTRFRFLWTPTDSSDETNGCFLLYCCACLHPDTIVMEAGWTTVPCPATNLSILICKSSAKT